MSVQIDSCYQNVIGISIDPCDCVDQSLIPVDYSESLSGLYFDQLPGIDLVMLNMLGSCNEVWTSIQKWISQGVNTMKVDAMREIMKKNVLRHYNYAGRIGSIRRDNYNPRYEDYSGVKMYCNPIRDGYMALKGIGVIMQDNASFNIELYNSIDDTAIHTIPVTAVAGRVQWNTLASPITLPLWNDDLHDLEYTFLYDTTGKRVADNKAICDCPGVKWCYDRHNPCFAQGRDVKERWRHWVMAGGVAMNDITKRDDATAGIRMNGLIFDVEFNCNSFATLCNSTITDFASDPFDNSQAQAVWYKAGEFALRAVLSSKELNIDTMTNREGLLNYIQYYIQEYQKQIEYIGKNADVQRSGCLACRDNYNVTNRTIYL
jgi:hypothetical protein